MFKLPQLQPQLTGNNGVERSKSASSYNPFFSSNSLRRQGKGEETSSIANSAFEVKGWESLAKEITHDVTQSDKYKSIALHAEVKLAEALERCSRVCPTVHAPGGEERPNKLKTAVCCQLLGEFAELCGPFSSVLKSIRDELLKSVYSWYYVSERGALVFDQLPWFTVAERLEREKEVMTLEREEFKKALQEQQDCIARIEEQVSTYQRAMQAAQEEAQSMKHKIEALSSSEELARIEAKTGREELKRARKEWMKMRDELTAEKETNAKLKLTMDESLNEMHERCVRASKQAEAAGKETEEMRRVLSTRPPPEELDSMKSKMSELREAMKESDAAAKLRIKDLEKDRSNLKSKMGSMTPKPSWQPVTKSVHIEVAEKTQETIARVAEKLAEFVKLEKAQTEKLKLLESLLHPDPQPYKVSLTIATDSSAYFITEESEGAADKDEAPARAEGLGMGPTVPRCLRWKKGSMITLRSMGLAQTEAELARIWKAKRVHDRAEPSQPLHSFLYSFYLAHAASNPQGSGATSAPASAAAAAAPADDAGKPSVASMPEAPESLHEYVVQHAYSLYAACIDYASVSPVVRLFWLVLSGVESEELQRDLALMVASLKHAIGALPLQPGGSPGGSCSAQATVDPASEAAPNGDSPAAEPAGATAREAASGGGCAEADSSSSSEPVAEEDAVGGAQALRKGMGTAEELDQACLSSQDVVDVLEAMFATRVPYKLGKLKEALSKQFPGDTIVASKLLSALEPYALPLLQGSTAFAEPFAGVGGGGGVGSQVMGFMPSTESGTFVSMLLEQYLEEMDAQSSDVVAKIHELTPYEVKEGKADWGGVDSHLFLLESGAARLAAGGIDEPSTTACMAKVLDLAVPLPGEQPSSALSSTLAVLAPAVMDAASFSNSLRNRCLLRTKMNYNIEQATSVAKSKAVAAN